MKPPRTGSPALLLALSLCAAPAFADPPGAAVAEAPRSVHRVDVTIRGLEENGAPPPVWTLVLRENETGSLDSGANVPLSAGAAPGASVPRADVGVRLRFNYSLRDGALLLTGDAELSTAAPYASGATVIHRLRAQGTTAVRPGGPALFAILYDLTTHRRYELEVSARRIL